MVPWAAGPTVRAREEQGTDAGPHLGEARSLLLPPSIIQLSLRPPDTLAGLTLLRPSMPCHCFFKGQQCWGRSPWGPGCRDLPYSCRMRMSLRGNSSQGHPSAHRLGCQAHLDTSALRLHLVPKWVQRASPAPVWHRAGAAGRAGETLLICFEIGLPEMCLRQMLQSQIIWHWKQGSRAGDEALLLLSVCGIPCEMSEHSFPSSDAPGEVDRPGGCLTEISGLAR